MVVGGEVAARFDYQVRLRSPRALDSDLRDRLRIKGESETDVATAEDMRIEDDGQPRVHTMQIGSDTPSPDPSHCWSKSKVYRDVATQTPTRN